MVSSGIKVSEKLQGNKLWYNRKITTKGNQEGEKKRIINTIHIVRYAPGTFYDLAVATSKT